MNAYQKAFKKYQKESLVPRWKTLFLTDQQDAWLGRILYQRRSQSLTATTGNPAWICAVQIPEDHKDAILTAWKEVWYDQLREQVNITQVEQHAIDTAAKSTSQDYAAAERLSRYLTRSTPPYNAGEEEGVENWIARFKYEYFWELQFAFLPADRQYFKEMRSVEELMEQMSSSHQEGVQASQAETMDTMVCPEAGLTLPASARPRC